MKRELGMFIALASVCVLIGWSNADFYGRENSFNTTRQIAMLGIFAVGVSFVMIQGGIDLSIGSIIGLTGVIIAKLSSNSAGGWGWPLWMGILVALMIALLIGFVQGLLITGLKLQPFIVTLGGMLLLRGISQVIVDGGTISLSTSALRPLGLSGLFPVNGTPLIPYPLLILAVVIVLAIYVLHFTVFGRYLFAIGGNRDAAVYSGIPVVRCEIATYMISAGLAGISGVCYAAYISQMSQNVGVAYELYAIAAAVLGGVSLRGGEGSIVGVIIGAALMRVIENGINLFKFTYRDGAGVVHDWRLSSNYTYVVIGAVILIAVILDQLVHRISERRKKSLA